MRVFWKFLYVVTSVGKTLYYWLVGVSLLSGRDISLMCLHQLLERNALNFFKRLMQLTTHSRTLIKRYHRVGIQTLPPQTVTMVGSKALCWFVFSWSLRLRVRYNINLIDQGHKTYHTIIMSLLPRVNLHCKITFFQLLLKTPKLRWASNEAISEATRIFT